MTSSGVRVTAIGAGLNALGAILPQLVALVLLTSSEYGMYSMVYLVYAAGLSSVYSVICDAWSRHGGSVGLRQWESYAGALTVFSVPFSLLAAIIGAVLGMGLVALTGAAATFSLIFRAGSRYYQTRAEQWGRVIVGDVGQIFGLVLGLLIGWCANWAAMSTVMFAWALSSALTLISTSPFPVTFAAPRRFRKWVRTYRKEIGPLLADSLLMDAGAIGTPYLLFPSLGLASFGIYRAVSNVATPVQLILSPLRPIVTGSDIRRLISIRLLGAITLLLGLVSLAAYIVIQWLPALPVRLGVLSDLYVVALPAALFVVANGLSFYLYLVARGHAARNRIFRARVIQTVIAIVAPVLGAWAGGLLGATWGFTGSALLFVPLWLWVARRSAESTSLPSTDSQQPF